MYASAVALGMAVRQRLDVITLLNVMKTSRCGRFLSPLSIDPLIQSASAGRLATCVYEH